MGGCFPGEGAKLPQVAPCPQEVCSPGCPGEPHGVSVVGFGGDFQSSGKTFTSARFVWVRYIAMFLLKTASSGTWQRLL